MMLAENELPLFKSTAAATGFLLDLTGNLEIKCLASRALSGAKLAFQNNIQINPTLNLTDSVNKR